MTASVLRIFALVCMLLDHTYQTILPEHIWLHCIGRLAFPIFAFQLVEGYRHTSNLKKYAGRLFLFALLSEIPFDLMARGTPFFWGHQNVLWTMLLGLATLFLADKFRDRLSTPVVRYTAIFLLCFLSSFVADALRTDYGSCGILQILIFYAFQSKKAFFLTAICTAVLHVLAGSTSLLIFGIQLPIQAFAALALALISQYNGAKGKACRAWPLFSYAFYPLHMLLLFLLTVIS